MTKPSPPNWTKSITTNSPKSENCTAISTVIKPVTQTDVVDEKSASMNESHLPSVFEIGRHSKNAPIKIRAAKPSKIYFAGVILKNCLIFEFEFINTY